MSKSSIRMRVALRDVTPEVWREFLVPGGSSLEELHEALQNVMGWTNSHLHEFVVRGARYAPHEPDDDLDGEVNETATTYLSDLALQPGDSVLYMYDFGDGWEHEVSVLGYGETLRGAKCLDGAGACPPEDCGGAPGYASMVAILADPSHPEHQDTTEWLGAKFDPLKFDVDEVNTILGQQ